jgi:hypothetical protein
MNEQTYRHTNKQTYRRTNAQTNEGTTVHRNERTNIQTYKQTNKQTYRRTYKQTYKRTDVQTNVQKTMYESAFSLDEIRRQSFLVFNTVQHIIQFQYKHKTFFTLPLELCFRIHIENTNKLTLLFTILKYNNLKTK